MRYLLFGKDDCYYASGGAHDFMGAGESIDDLAKSEAIMVGRYEIAWWHIFDTVYRKIVAVSECQAYGAPDMSEIIKNG